MNGVYIWLIPLPLGGHSKYTKEDIRKLLSHLVMEVEVTEGDEPPYTMFLHNRPSENEKKMKRGCTLYKAR